MEENKPTNIFFITAIIVIIIAGSAFYLKQVMNTTEQKETAPPDITVASSSPEVVISPSAITNRETNNKKSMNTITLDTNMGKIVFETYNSDAPKTVENFITLAKKGFYDGIIFHRVIDGFMIQGGDPTGTGMGGPGYKFADELDPNTASYKAGYQKGVVAMANSGPNTNGSQFFIMLQDYPLPNSYTIFGKVISGQEVVDAIGKVKTGANDKPVSPVTILKATVSE